jgi:hypothetical protein
MSLLSANVIVCEAALTEKTTEVISAIRIMNVLTITRGVQFAQFYTVAFLASTPGDQSPHRVRVEMQTKEGKQVAEAPDVRFYYGYQLDSTGPGFFTLTTAFNLDLARLDDLGHYTIRVLLDDKCVCAAPLVMRRG